MPQQVLGKLTLNENWDVVKSSGDLENDTRVAGVIRKLVIQLTANHLLYGTAKSARVSIHYNEHCYVITKNNGNVNVVKLHRTPLVPKAEPEAAAEPDKASGED